MDLAEQRMRQAGYHGFSYRELASEIGITSASVHHHFPTKTDMVVAIMQRYNERFAELVAAKPGETPEEVIEAFRLACRDSLCAGQGMCLSGVLGAESSALPPELLGMVEQFFRDAIESLAERIGGPDAEERAHVVFATLEGAQILARAYGDISAYDRATLGLAERMLHESPQLAAPAILAGGTAAPFK
jgi:TetR/AcrR family transcriptional repressor of nem operon